jgi:hypothetical protein
MDASELRMLTPEDIDRRTSGAVRPPRLETRLWVGIPEVEGDPELENCDISTSRDAGAPGAVRMLRLVSADREEALEVMARVVRVVPRIDASGARAIEAIGFEFLPHGDAHRQELGRFLQHVAEAEIAEVAAAAAAVEMEATDEVAATPLAGEDAWSPDAQVGGLEVTSMVIETSWPIEMGETIRAEIEIPTSGRRIRLSGKALGAAWIGEGEDDDRYRVTFGFDAGDAAKPAAPAHEGPEVSFEEALSAIFDEASTPSPITRQQDGVHLSGALSEVGLPSLLGFIELERASGVLHLTRDSQRAAIFVSEGRILDVESETPGSPEQALGDLLSWPEGAFEFRFQVVDREDVVGKPIGALLLNLARESDEASR